MSIFLILAYLFFVGSVLGWLLELGFRNMKRKGGGWINPGFCAGPYVPIYGFGLCVLYLLASLESYELIENPVLNRSVLFFAMAVCMTAMEYVAGLFCLKVLKVRLWDYSGCRGNVQGIICPRFSLFWALLGAVYYFAIHPHILEGLQWLSQNLAFSFFIGMFFGVFLVDVMYSAQLIVKMKGFAESHDLVLRYEAIKGQIRERQSLRKKKTSFLLPFESEKPLREHLKEIYGAKELHNDGKES